MAVCGRTVSLTATVNMVNGKKFHCRLAATFTLPAVCRNYSRPNFKPVLFPSSALFFTIRGSPTIPLLPFVFGVDAAMFFVPFFLDSLLTIFAAIPNRSAARPICRAHAVKFSCQLNATTDMAFFLFHASILYKINVCVNYNVAKVCVTASIGSDRSFEISSFIKKPPAPCVTVRWKAHRPRTRFETGGRFDRL